MIGRCPVPISLAVYAHFGARLCVLLLNQIFENSVPFDNTTLIYLINLFWKLVLGFRLGS